MRDGFRYLLLLVAGLIAVLFIISFTAWGLTTYGSIRHIAGDMAAQPDKAADLRDQYEDMTTYFAGSTGNIYTYHFRLAPITVDRVQVSGMGQSGVISLVLDSYASGLYNNNLPSGGPGVAGMFIGSTGNLLYAITSLILVIAFILFMACAILWFPDRPRSFNMKSAGKVIAVVCTLTFFVFALLPGLLKSLFWGSISNSGATRDILSIIEPGVVGSLLRNTLIIILLTAVLYAAGYWMGARGEVRAVFKASRASAQQDPEDHKRKSL